MKGVFRGFVAVLLVALLNGQGWRLFAQGALTPPGPPGATMKTLSQIEPRTPISLLPFMITNGGSYYLTTNLTGFSGSNGVIIATGNVTIDLNGFALVGVSNSASGIYVNGGYSNIIVRNGLLSGWGGNGIDAGSSNPHSQHFEHLIASGNGGTGLYIGNAVVRDCVCQNNAQEGIAVAAPSTISGCSVINNTNLSAAGLFFAADCVVRDTQIAYNYAGIFGLGSRCELHNCQVNSNAADGVLIYYNGIVSNVAGCATLISGCSFMGNGHNGINMQGGSSDGTPYGSSAMISDCSVVANGQNGIYLSYSPGSKVANCNVIGNILSGIYVSGDNSRIVGNNVSGNNASNNTNYAGIEVIYANYCRIDENHINNNGYVGIFMNNGIYNTFVKNQLNDYYYFGSGNDIGPIGTAASATSPWANIRY